MDRFSLLLVIVGAINWGLVGLFQFDLIAFLFGGQAAMISRVLADLVRSGLVQKCGAPGKYNAIYRLTDAGRDRAVRVRAVVADVSRRADEGIDPGELAIFYKVLAQLTENLEAVEADPTAAFAPLED